MAIDKNLLLVGSIPLDTAEKVFRACAGAIGNDLFCIPDGEVGERRYWTNFQCYRVFHGHPDLETVRRPDPRDGVCICECLVFANQTAPPRSSTLTVLIGKLLLDSRM